MKFTISVVLALVSAVAALPIDPLTGRAANLHNVDNSWKVSSI